MLLDTSGLFCYFHADEPKSPDAQVFFEAAGNKPPSKLTCSSPAIVAVPVMFNWSYAPGDVPPNSILATAVAVRW